MNAKVLAVNDVPYSGEKPQEQKITKTKSMPIKNDIFKNLVVKKMKEREKL